MSFLQKIKDFLKRKEGIAMATFTVLVVLLLIIFLVVLPSQSKGSGKGGILVDTAGAEDPHPSQFEMSMSEQCSKCQPMVDDDALEEQPGADGLYGVDMGRITMSEGSDWPVECRTPWSGLPVTHADYKGGVSECNDANCPRHGSLCTKDRMDQMKASLATGRFTENGRLMA